MSERRLVFRTETRRLLDIVINSLYSHPDVFLRELVSNASDALDRLRYEAITRPELLDPPEEPAISIVPDSRNGTLTVRDNGIGMTADEMAGNLGTIAGSGTRAFAGSLEGGTEADAPELIGQFGVGFYSSFMVASEVEVRSRSAGPGGAGALWRSTGRDTFTVGPCDRPGRGTEVVLHLKPGMEEYLDPGRIRTLVETYSDFIAWPILLEVPGQADRPVLNTRTPIWTRPEIDVPKSEYDDFYRHHARDFDAPWARLVYRGEGTAEFHSLLFIPARRQLSMLLPDSRGGLSLYARRVLVMHGCPDLLPRWMRFVHGVVESSDLPLNISREMLQQNQFIRVMRKALTARVLSWLESLSADPDMDYPAFFEQFGDFVKEGIYTDPENRERLAGLLCVWTTLSPDRPVPVSTLLDRTSGDLLYVTGTDRSRMVSLPHLESALRSGAEVILFDSPVDEVVLQVMGEIRGRRLVPLDRDGAAPEPSGEDAVRLREAGVRLAGLVEFLQGRLAGKVREVRLSARLHDYPCALVADRNDPGEAFRTLMKAIHQDIPETPRILEVSIDHPVIIQMNRLFEEDRTGDRLALHADLLLDLASILGGGRPEDPAGFGRVIAGLLAPERGTE